MSTHLPVVCGSSENLRSFKTANEHPVCDFRVGSLGIFTPAHTRNFLSFHLCQDVETTDDVRDGDAQTTDRGDGHLAEVCETGCGKQGVHNTRTALNPDPLQVQVDKTPKLRA